LSTLPVVDQAPHAVLRVLADFVHLISDPQHIRDLNQVGVNLVPVRIVDLHVPAFTNSLRDARLRVPEAFK
jgi:hypothetical protein